MLRPTDVDCSDRDEWTVFREAAVQHSQTKTQHSGINQETPETQKDVREFCMTKHAMYALHITTFSSETVHRDKRRQVTMTLHLFGSWTCIQKIFVRTIDHYGGFDFGSFMTCTRFDLSFLDLWIFMA